MTVQPDSPNTTPTPEPLPPGWAWTTLGEVRLSTSSGIQPAQTPQQVFELYSVPSFPSGTPETLSGGEIGSNKQTVEPGMVLLSKINPRINRVWVVGPKKEHPQIASTEWITFAPLSIMEPAYLAYFMRQSKFRDYLAANVSGVGGSLTRTNAAVVDRYDFPLPPLPEQQRIVSRIEELFSKLNAGVEGLRRTQALLKRYRQSLLHAAVTGELSREWRAQNSATETGAELLERILKERREKWAASGKKGKYKEPQGPSTEGLAELPEGWVWASVGQLIFDDVQNGLYLPSSKYGSGVPILRIDDFQDGWSRDSDALRRVNAEIGDREKYSLKLGDVIVNRVNSMTHIGKSVVIEQRHLPAIFESNMMRFSLSKGVEPRFLNLYFRSGLGKRLLTKNAKQAVNQASINQGDVTATQCPLPPTAEQAFIVSEVERRLSVLDNMEATVAAELKRAEAMRQSILHQAFSGQLVAQDPNDEPVSALLERIQAEKVKAGAKAFRAGTGRRDRKPKPEAEPVLLCSDE